MGFIDKILESLEEPVQQGSAQPSGSPQGPFASPTYRPSQTTSQQQSPPVKPVSAKAVTDAQYRKSRESTAEKPLEIVGYPIIYPPIKWDDIGLGLSRSMGFIPNKAVKLIFKHGTWTISGSKVNPGMLLFILAGAGGMVYFLRDLLMQIEDWGWVWNIAIGILIPVLSFFIRKQTLEFKSYELEMLAFDRENGVLVVSTIVEPGGAIALKIDLPSDPKRRLLETNKLIAELKKAYSSYMNIDGLAKQDVSKFKEFTK